MQRVMDARRRCVAEIFRQRGARRRRMAWHVFRPGREGVPRRCPEGSRRFGSNLHHVVEMQDVSPVAAEMQDVVPLQTRGEIEIASVVPVVVPSS